MEASARVGGQARTVIHNLLKMPAAAPRLHSIAETSLFLAIVGWRAIEVTEDTVDTAEDLLQQIQTALEQQSAGVEAVSGVDRREFVFMSLVAAAASTLGVHAARGQASGATAQQTVPEIALGNGEPPAMVFQAYPGGTGAFMEKLAKE